MNGSDIKTLLAERNLPDLFTFEDGAAVTAENADKRRDELLKIMQREVYGIMPPAPPSFSFVVKETENTRCCAGKGIYKKITLTFPINGNKFSFDFKMILPKYKQKPPFVIIANFRDSVPDEYVPAEELIDRGVGFAVFCHKTDITTDDNDFTDKLAGIIYPDGTRKSNTDCGKIAMWAYCQSRILDYILENEDVDTSHIAVAGHSRLGKTALFAAACDKRFTCAYSNDSGCSGAAITRGKQGENVEAITRVFPFWFCHNYKQYANNESSMPFDQHFLVASIAPRRVYIASAIEDTWADPQSEFLCCYAASDFWKLYGVENAFLSDDKLPTDVYSCHGKSIGYHLRSGVHYLSRYDWNKFLDFFLK